MTVHEKYKAMRERWMKTDDDTELQAFFRSPEYRSMSYLEKNRGWLTGSKIKIFATDQWWYKLLYVDEMPPPYQIDTENEALLIGSCFDDRVTYSMEEVQRQYEVMKRTVPDIEDALSEAAAKLAEAQNSERRKKDGSRYADDMKAEQDALERIAYLNTLKGKKQITESQYAMVEQLSREFYQNEVFHKNVEKHWIVFRIGKIPCKVELDDYLPLCPQIGCLKGKEEHAIIDNKTCASLSTMKIPEGWLEQLSVYQLGIEERTFKFEPVWDGRPVCGIIQAVDKHGLWSRSRAFYYSPERLKDARGMIVNKITECWEAMQQGVFFKNPGFNGDCPFYGVDGYGRETDFVIV